MEKRFFYLGIFFFTLLFTTKSLAQDLSSCKAVNTPNFVQLQRLGNGQAFSITLNPSNATLAVASADGLWIDDAQTLAKGDVFESKDNPFGGFVISWSPSGRYIASYIDPIIGIRIWDIKNKEIVYLKPGNDSINPIFSLVWSPDESQIAARSTISIYVWDKSSQKLVFSQTGTNEIIQSALLPNAVVWSPNGNYLATSGLQNEHQAQIWNTSTWKAVAQLDTNLEEVLSLAWSNVNQLAIAGKGTVIELWSIDNWQRQFTVNIEATAIFSMQWSPTATQLAIGSDANSSSILNMPSGKADHTFLQSDWIYTVLWSSDGTQLTTFGRDGTISVWDVRSGQQKAQSKNYWTVGWPAWSSNGNWIAVPYTKGDSSSLSAQESIVRIWDALTGKNIIDLSRNTTSSLYDPLVWSPDGTKIAAFYAGNVQIWDSANKWKVSEIKTPETIVRRVIWSLDGKQVATIGDSGEGSEPDIYPLGNIVRLWDPQTGALIKTLAETTTQVLTVPTSKGWYIIKNSSGKVEVQSEDGQNSALSVENAALLDAIITPSVKRLALVTRKDAEKKEVSVWDIETGKEILNSEVNSSIYAVFASPEGNILDIFLASGDILPWNIAEKHKLALAEEAIKQITWSPDGSCVAFSTVELQNGQALVDIASTNDFKHIAQPEIITGVVVGMTWSPDSTKIAISSSDGILRIWGNED